MTEPTRPTPAQPHDETSAEKLRTATEIAIRLGVLYVIVAWCLQIVAPFIGIVLWGLIISIAASNPYERLTALFGGRRALSATTLVLLALILVIAPAVVLSETLIGGAQRFADEVAAGGLQVPPPPKGVEEWPLVGNRIAGFWQLSSENLEEAFERMEPQLRAVSSWLLKAAGSAGVAMLQFVASVIIAGVLLMRNDGRRLATGRLAARLAGDRGEELTEIAESTVRSVVQGIVGVALIQSVLAGIGFSVVGLPAAGLWALLVLVVAIVQLPVALILTPPVLIVFSNASTGVGIAFLVWALFISLLDNLLKPILFGRGVKVPTVVVFIGAIGGMLAMGIIGLFVGAVVLALGYQILLAWLSTQETPAAEASA